MSQREDPVHVVGGGRDDQRGRLVRTLDVDGEVFAVRRGHEGGTDYDWISGPNQGYGFSSSQNPSSSLDEHRRSIREFLRMIDPATGCIADD